MTILQWLQRDELDKLIPSLIHVILYQNITEHSGREVGPNLALAKAD